MTAILDILVLLLERDQSFSFASSMCLESIYTE